MLLIYSKMTIIKSLHFNTLMLKYSIYFRLQTIYRWITLFQKKGKKNDIAFAFLQVSLAPGWIEDCWVLLCAVVRNQPWYVVLVEVNEENLASHADMQAEKEGIFNILFRLIVGIFLWNLTIGSFLKVSCNRKSGTIHEFFILYYIKPLVYLLLWRGLLPHTVYRIIINWSYIKYWLIMQVFHTLTRFTTHGKEKITFVTITSYLIRRVFLSPGKLSRS